MNTAENLKTQGQDLVRQTENYVRGNPIPSLLGAVAVGFALGLIARSLETRREPEPIHDALNELRALLLPLAKKTRKGLSESSDAVREAVEQAVERAREIDLDPVAGWWKRLWS